MKSAFLSRGTALRSLHTRERVVRSFGEYPAERGEIRLYGQSGGQELFARKIDPHRSHQRTGAGWDCSPPPGSRPVSSTFGARCDVTDHERHDIAVSDRFRGHLLPAERREMARAQGASLSFPKGFRTSRLRINSASAMPRSRRMSPRLWPRPDAGTALSSPSSGFAIAGGSCLSCAAYSPRRPRSPEGAMKQDVSQDRR